MITAPAPNPATRRPESGVARRRVSRVPSSNSASGIGVILVLLVAVLAVGVWHLTQGSSGLTPGELVRGLFGAELHVGGVSVHDVFMGSRLPRLCAGIAVGCALGAAGALLQSVTRNPLSSPDTLAVSAGAYFALAAVAAFGLSVPFWASSGVAFVGGLLAAAVVLGVTGRGAGTMTTRLILAGSAVAMALDAATAMLLILFKENTTGLFAWGSGSLAQLNIDASLRATPIIVAAIIVALLIARRLDVLRLGEDAAAAVGVPVRSTRTVAVLCAVLLTSISVTVAGPIAFVGLGAPVLVRLVAHRVPALYRHTLLIPASALAGALLILLADVALRALLGAEGATAIPTGIPTALLGGIVIIFLALRMRDAGTARIAETVRSALRTRKHFLVVVAIAGALLIGMLLIGMLAGSMWLKLGDIALWVNQSAPDLVARAFDERGPRVAAATLAGAALALSGVVVQGTVRNPLAEPSLLGITAGAGLGAVIVVTTGIGGGGRPMLIAMAVFAGLATFCVITLLAMRGGLLPDRYVLVGIGASYALSAVTAFLLLRSEPWETPRILTWLSGTTYGRSLGDVIPVALVLIVVAPLLFAMHRRLDLLAIDEDTPRILGLQPQRTRIGLLALAALLAAVAVVAVGTVGFVGLVAPHLARTLVGARHARIMPAAMLIGSLLVLVADTLGRTLIAPSQLPAGLMIALIGAPYFVWLIRRAA